MVNESYKPIRIDVKKSISIAKLRPGFMQEWKSLEEEYAALEVLLSAVNMAGLTREKLAGRMGTTKSAISHLESSLRNDKHSPSFSTLKKYTNPCGKKLVF